DPTTIGLGDEGEQPPLLRTQPCMAPVHPVKERGVAQRRAAAARAWFSGGGRSGGGRRRAAPFHDLHLSRDLRSRKEGSLGGGTPTLPNVRSDVNTLSRTLSKEILGIQRAAR